MGLVRTSKSWAGPTGGVTPYCNFCSKQSGCSDRLRYALMLTPGNVSDIKAVPALLERDDRMQYLLGDKGYDAESTRCGCRVCHPRAPQSETGRPLGQAAIPRTAPHRKRVLPSEGLPSCRHPLRQAGRHLSFSRRARRCHRLLDLNEAEPYSLS